MGKVSAKDIVKKFEEAFKDKQYEIVTEERDYGNGLLLAVRNNKTNKMSSVIVEGERTTGGTFGWFYDDIWEETIWKEGPPYTHEKIGLITHPDTIDENIQKLREVIG